jgi:hypothetical protein
MGLHAPTSFTEYILIQNLNKYQLEIMHAIATYISLCREYERGKYHCTVGLLFDWFGLACFANKNKNCQLLYSLLQTSQAGG